MLSKEREREYIQGAKKGRELNAGKAEEILSREKKWNSMNDELKAVDEIS